MSARLTRHGLSAGIAVAAATVSSAADIVARAPTGVTSAAEKLLAEGADPWRLKLNPGEEIADVARHLCGRLTPTYFGLLQHANRDRKPNQEAVVPACFVTRMDVEVPVRSGDTLKTVAWRSVGVDGPKTIEGIAGANASLSVPWTSAHFSLPANLETLRVPVTTEPVIYSVKSGQDAGEFARRLNLALGTPNSLATGSTPVDELILEADVIPGSGTPVACQGALASKYQQWPFAISEIAAALTRIDERRVALGTGPASPALVSVVDNGMDRIFEAEFPKEDFVLNSAELANPGRNADGNAYPGDIVGTNIYDGGQPTYFAQADKPGHGTLMASLALGGEEYRGWQKSHYPARRVKIRAISMVRMTNESSPQGNVARYSLPPEALEKALAYVVAGNAKTANLSVSTPNRLSKVEQSILNYDDLLLVVAAGNGAYELDIKSRYPASASKWESAYGGRLITVAAHDRRGCLSSFSGRGKRTVDLASPGEQIAAIGLRGQLITAEGTSQASALTSFVAALVRASGDLSPSAVKNRLLASVDLSPDLSQFVRSEGALNVRKALSLYDDVLEVSQAAGPIFGQLSSLPSPGLFCPQLAGDSRHVLKVSKRVDGGDTAQIRLLLRNDEKEGEVLTVHCLPSTATFTLNSAAGPRAFKLTDLIDYVPRI